KKKKNKIDRENFAASRDGGRRGEQTAAAAAAGGSRREAAADNSGGVPLLEAAEGCRGSCKES
ncbi:hypothetical protein L9G74_21955, partial [Shewanella sp. C32]|nr:hypothetical protein [Shewanella electrica]